jgi:hypothetical protein
MGTLKPVIEMEKHNRRRIILLQENDKFLHTLGTGWDDTNERTQVRAAVVPWFFWRAE